MFAKASLAILSLFASASSGVMLGGYTIGGFNMTSSPGIVADGARVADEKVDQTTSSVAVPADAREVAYICTGCDARPYRDRDLDSRYVSYITVDDPADQSSLPDRGVREDDPVPQPVAQAHDADDDREVIVFGVTLPTDGNRPSQRVALAGTDRSLVTPQH